MGESPLQYLANAEEIDIKIAQGVKPGDGKSSRVIFFLFAELTTFL